MTRAGFFLRMASTWRLTLAPPMACTALIPVSACTNKRHLVWVYSPNRRVRACMRREGRTDGPRKATSEREESAGARAK